MNWKLSQISRRVLNTIAVLVAIGLFIPVLLLISCVRQPLRIASQPENSFSQQSSSVTPAIGPIDKQSSQTISWKEYVNEHGGYQYSYPPNWQSNEPCQSFTGPECGDGPQNRSTVNAPNSKYPDGFLSVAYFQRGLCSSFANKARNWSWEGLEEISTVLDGSSASMYKGAIDFTDNNYYDRKYILVVHNNRCYVLDSWSLPSSDHRQILAQILSTFKFLK